jgi:hypothetical protein
MDWTPEPFPGFDQITVPTGSGPAKTVTSAEAVPAVIVVRPTASAVRMGGSSVDKLTTVGLVELQVSPVTGWLLAFRACTVFVSPRTMFSRLGTMVRALVPDVGTVKVSALLHTPFCRIRATPDKAAGSTTATTWVLLQLIT